ncbi:MAG: (Fe-S)-binding protein [Deltaproteobacteria bacterium]|nr:(Fe-S)-binding protein [Deltaproteobacteria bacterium]
MIKYIKEERIKLDKSKYNVITTYHDPCNYGRKAEKLFGHGFFDEPRWILDQCLESWVDLYPSKRDQFCCGGGGGTMTTGYNEERIFYGRKKMEQIKATNAKMVVVPCHSCHGQINSIKKEYEMEELEVKYLWELVADILIMD